MMTEKEHTLNLDPFKESIKLVKTTKSYTWEIKIHPQKEELGEEDIRRVKQLNELLKNKFDVYD